MNSATAVISLVCLIAFLQSCNCTKCYSCIYPFNAGCDKIANDKYLIECSEDFGCFSLVLTNKEEKVVVRECEPKGTKYSLVTCSSDGCNGKELVSNVTTYDAEKLLKCYECSSHPIHNNPNPQCEDIVGDEYLITCDRGEICGVFKSVYGDENIYSLNRGCVPEDVKISSQIHCEKDKCNGENAVTVTKNKHFEYNILKMFKFFEF